MHITPFQSTNRKKQSDNKKMSFQFCFASAPYVWKGVAFIFVRLGFLPAVTTCVHAKRNIDTAAAAATANVVDGGGGAPMGQK